MIKKRTAYTDIYLFEKLTGYETVLQFVSTNILKRNGAITHEFDISYSGGMPYEQVLQNRKLLAETAQIPEESFVMQKQVHGNDVRIVTKADKGKGFFEDKHALQNSDAMITNEKNVCLFLFAADCVPILFFDPVKNVIGAAHAGWKGTVKKIAFKTVKKMQDTYGSDPKDIIVCIGPSISVNNYEIGKEVVQETEKSFGSRDTYLLYNPKSEKYHMDLWYSNLKLLKAAGVSEKNIELAGICTYENTDEFFSARQKNTGRFAAGIMFT